GQSDAGTARRGPGSGLPTYLKVASRCGFCAYDCAIDIEERELHYSPDAPLRAWRLFRIGHDTIGPVLLSPVYHGPEPTPWPELGSVASCYEDHKAPAPGCRCGIYAAIEGTIDSLPGYLLDTSYDRNPWAYAEVACSGHVFVDMRGIRAECAAIVRLALAEASWPDREAFDAAQRRLRERYRVAVGGLEGVPDWVTRNRRAQGPPPDDSGLALDLQRLDLWTA